MKTKKADGVNPWNDCDEAIAEAKKAYTQATAPAVRDLKKAIARAYAIRNKAIARVGVIHENLQQTHFLKCDSLPFQALARGDKTAEFRRNDRDFRVGDTLVLREMYEDAGETGEAVAVVISHIQTGYGVPEGYAMLSVKALPKEKP